VTASHVGLSLRLSVTDRCQFRCRYCMPPEGIGPLRHEEILTYEEIAAFVHYLQTEFCLTKVRLTGGDPLIRRDLTRLIQMLAALGIPDLALTTNGQLLAGKAVALKRAGLKRVNISLDSLVPTTFCHLSRGGQLENTVQGIGAALHHNLRPVKLNMVVLRGINDHEVSDMLSFALHHGCKMRFLELMPLGAALENFEKWFMSSDEVFSRLSRSFRMSPISFSPGDTARNYRVSDYAAGEGIVGFISPHTRPFCEGCRRLRLTADGHILGCLGQGSRISIKPFLRPEKSSHSEDIRGLIESALMQKRNRPMFAMSSDMSAIGG